MKSRTTAKFRKLLDKLPAQARRQARQSYRQFRQDPNRSSLRFKQIHAQLPVYSCRVGKHYRAVGQKEGDMVVWFWIGSHSDYDKLLSQM